MPTLCGTPQCAERVAGRFVGAAMAGADGDAEESNLKPGSRALHAICPRGHEIDCCPATISQEVMIKTKRTSRPSPSIRKAVVVARGYRHEFFLQCVSPELAHRVEPLQRSIPSAY